MKSFKILSVFCIVSLFFSVSCMRSDEHQDRNTAHQYDYIDDHLVAANGTWKNNWVSSFDSSDIEFKPSISTRQYKGLEIFFNSFKNRNVVYDICKEDKNTYIEIYCVYRDEMGNEAILPINETNKDQYLVVTNYANTRLGFDFDLLPPTTERIKMKFQKGRITGYIDPCFKL